MDLGVIAIEAVTRGRRVAQKGVWKKRARDRKLGNFANQASLSLQNTQAETVTCSFH